MLDKLSRFILGHRLLVILGAVILQAAGIVAWNNLPVDAFPDVTSQQVMILTEAAGLTPAEVERLITFPIEVDMGGLPDVKQVRSLSKTGLSQVVIIFEDHVDTYFARQIVFERLAQVKDQLPEGAEPELGPISTGLGEIYQYVLEAGFYCPDHRQTWSRFCILRPSPTPIAVASPPPTTPFAPRLPAVMSAMCIEPPRPPQ